MVYIDIVQMTHTISCIHLQCYMYNYRMLILSKISTLLQLILMFCKDSEFRNKIHVYNHFSFSVPGIFSSKSNSRNTKTCIYISSVGSL